MPAVGVDFGTTNSALALVGPDGQTVKLAHFSFMETMVETFRSVLFFPGGGKPLSGPQAIESYLEPHEGGRLIQSLKSFAASSTFSVTLINGRSYTLEELVGLFLRTLRSQAEAELGPLGNRLVAGRPVRFVGADTPEDEERALGRLSRAFAVAGFDDIEFEYEPVGAAHSYAQRLSREELVLIADFGGGTSDFSLIRLGRGGSTTEIIGNSGVPVGGDTFDARIIRHLVSPMLGLGMMYRSLGKVLPMPSSLYIKLESWHHLSFLRSRETVRMIENLRAQADDPEKLDRLLEIVQEDLGYHLHRAVQRLKVELSRSEEAEFVFRDASVKIQRRVKRAQFDSWIFGELVQIRAAVSDLLEATGTQGDEIDRVFLTGGSSLVPAVRRVFAEGFGEDRLAAGDEFTSVARGLALRAAHSSAP